MKKYLLSLLAMVLAACGANAQPHISANQADANNDDLPPLAIAQQEVTATKTETPMPTNTPLPTNTPTPEPYRSSLPNLGEAPELENEVWLNTEELLRLADLRGQVVLLEMWTFDCINCIHVIPSLRQWHETYSDQGLVIIGNHYPEFSYERELNNLKDAIVRLDIPYAVAQDNDRVTWAAYHNRYWPTLYLIDKWGNIRYSHIGEGAYDRTDDAIKDLLAEDYP